MFQFAGQLYKFVCLPNGLTSARRLFPKILKPVFAALHKERHDIVGYLDDSILFGDNYDVRKPAVLRAVNLFQSLGFPSPLRKVFSNTKTGNRFPWIYYKF